MTIQEYENRAEVALTTAQDVAIHRLGEWAQSAQAAHSIATTLVQTSFCPDAFRNKPGEATAAILAGIEVGLQPMAALRSFDVIQGQAAARAMTLRAIVQSAGHEIVLVESTSARCRMKGRRKGSSEWQTVTWDMARAQQLKLTNKSNWKDQPTAMLLARATSELARLIASDAILGIPYSAEEIADGGAYEQQAGEVTAAPASSGTRKMSRRKPAAEDGTPERDEEGQRAAMFATFNEAAKVGIVDDDRDARLAYCAKVVGHDVESSSALDWDEVSAVIDSLKADMTALEDPFPDAIDADVVDEPGGAS